MTEQQISQEQLEIQKKVYRAVTEAREAQRDWSEKTFKQRAQYLKTVHYRISERTQSISQAIFDDIKKPIRSAIGGDILPTLDNLKEMMNKGHKVLKDENPSASLSQFYIGSRKLKIIRQAYGVVGVIGTWNYPIYLNFDTICAALLAGNTVIWKPSELTPRTNEIIYRMFDELPRGVLIMLGGGGEVGKSLSQAEVDRIVFTGSTSTGRKVAAQAGARLTPVATEMSGKDTLIVMENADVKLAAQAAAFAITNYAGQSSVKPQRLLVHEQSYDRFRTLLKDAMEKIEIGPADRPSTQMGPLINDKAVALADHLVKEAVSQGATLLTGGEPATEFQGPFYYPTILENVTNKMRIERGDLWAPVASLRKYSSEAEVVQLVNRHPLGFTASIFNKKTLKAINLGNRLDVGTIMVNSTVLSVSDAKIPFGGRRLSGNMERHGVWGIRDMTRPKTITITEGWLAPIYRGTYKFTKRWQIVTIAIKANQYYKAFKAFKSRRLAREE